MTTDFVGLLFMDAKNHFVDNYLKDADSDVLAAETLGLVISQWAEYDGEKIALFLTRAFAAGLEDANWHTEAGVFYDWLEEMEQGARIGELLGEGK